MTGIKRLKSIENSEFTLANILPKEVLAVVELSVVKSASANSLFSMFRYSFYSEVLPVIFIKKE